MKQQQVEIFVDLDGVLYNYDKRVNELLGHGFAGHNTEEVWKELAEKYQNLYEDMELMPDAMELWDYIKCYSPKILTGIPSLQVFRLAPRHKWASVKKDLGVDVPVLFGPYSQDKQLWCTGQNCLLIDDRKRNCEQWAQRGGVAILHQDAYTTIKALGEMGL